MKTRLLGLAAALMCACSGPDLGPVVAEHAGQSLHLAELRLHLPPRLPAADSARLAEAYVAQWKREATLAQAAEDLVPDWEDRIAARMRAHERNLKLMLWQEQVLANNLDTTLTPQVMDQYYKLHADRFITAEPLFQYYYVRTANPNTPELRKRMPSANPFDVQTVINWCKTNNVTSKMDDSYRPKSDLDSLQKFFPGFALHLLYPGAPVVVGSTPGSFPTELHFFYLKNTLPAGKPKPMNMVAPQLRSIILQQRAQEVLKKAEAQLLAQ